MAWKSKKKKVATHVQPTNIQEQKGENEHEAKSTKKIRKQQNKNYIAGFNEIFLVGLRKLAMLMRSIKSKTYKYLHTECRRC